jgi:protein ImuB
MNFAVVLAPNFALQALRRSDPALANKPFAIAEGEGRNARIAAASEHAAGVHPGLAVTLAMSRCPGLALRPRDPDAEAEITRILLAAAFTLSPRVELTAEGACTVSLQGADSAGTETRMRACVADLARAGVSARAGAGATPLLAGYAARAAAPVLLVGDAVAFLGPLPLAVAAPTPTQAAVLNGWGIATLGQLTALPKAEIAQRLGTDGVLLWERAAGESTRVLRLVEPVRTFAAEWTYEPPVETLEPLLFRMRRFAERVALELRGAGRVAEGLSLTLLLDDDSDHSREFRLPEPTTDVDGWMRVLQAHLDSVETDAPVTGVRLRALPARPPVRQDGLFDTALRDPAVFWENLARLAAIVGDDRVGTPQRLDTWRPDAVALTRPADAVPAPEDEPVHPPCGPTLRRFRPPWNARVETIDHRPASIEADELRDVVRAARGPFHLSGTWWKAGEEWALEVWQVEVGSGGAYQLTRTAAGWWVEGVLD